MDAAIRWRGKTKKPQNPLRSKRQFDAERKSQWQHKPSCLLTQLFYVCTWIFRSFRILPAPICGLGRIGKHHILWLISPCHSQCSMVSEACQGFWPQPVPVHDGCCSFATSIRKIRQVVAPSFFRRDKRTLGTKKGGFSLLILCFYFCRFCGGKGWIPSIRASSSVSSSE